MSMKKLLLALAAVAVMSSACQKAEVEAPVNEGRVLDATIENIAVTRTVMDEDNNIRWSEGDQIVGFMKSTFGAKFQVTGSSVGETSASFEEVSSDGLNAGTELDHIIAYYPYSSSVKIAKSGSNYALDVVLPAEQTYVQESFGNGAMPMVAVSETNNITFRNVCGGMKLQLKGTQKVASVKVEGKNGEILSGAAVVIAYTDGTKPSITMSDETPTSVTLNCGSGVQLNENDAVEFIIVLPPVAFSKGFVVTVADAAGNVQTIETDKVNEVKRSALLVMPEVTLKGVNVNDGSIDLSLFGTSNSYLVKESGTYKFPTVKGNSDLPVGSPVSAEVLWETFGSATKPEVGDLIQTVDYSDGYVTFITSNPFNDGNAVIVVKDASGVILWSWHIWCAKEGYQEHTYANNAGILMDRNLGATSSTPGNPKAIGLLYQWGRKDPFVASSHIEDETPAAMAACEPYSIVERTSETGTIEYAVAHPNILITLTTPTGTDRYDWCVDADTKGNERWQPRKTIYDPCPPGWRVPDGGENGVWMTAGFPVGINGEFDKTNLGMSFSAGLTGSFSWFPATGFLDTHISNGISLPLLLSSTGYQSSLWTTTLNEEYDDRAYSLKIDPDNSPNGGYVNPMSYFGISIGNPVRCMKEDSNNGVASEEIIDLSDGGVNTSNCYIVEHRGKYKIPTVKGNSNESVGEVASVEVLWETYGNGSAPNKGDLISNLEYSAGYINFSTASMFRNGNALVAAKDAKGKILWSWHIWFSAHGFREIEYANGAGIMMDRNLGATSDQPGTLGSLGLLYQWGRKDPFISSQGGFYDIEGQSMAQSTLYSWNWPRNNSGAVSIDYSLQNPYTYVCGSEDWCSDVDVVRWHHDKTIYDPCPAGWRVPDGGEDGIWYKAGMVYSESSQLNTYIFDNTNKGFYLPETICIPKSWYPAAGCKSDEYYNGAPLLEGVGIHGQYWSCTEDKQLNGIARKLDFNLKGNVNPLNGGQKYRAFSVRCQKE